MNKNTLRNKKFFSSESSSDKLSKRSSVICYTLWNFWSLCAGVYPLPFQLMEASIDGVASTALHNNPSRLDASLLYLTALVNNQLMKVMLDTGS